MESYSQLIDHYYPEGSLRREIFMDHSTNVADLALEIAAKQNLQLDREEIREAAMLHDIGICFTDAPGLGCYGTQHYLMHGILGGKLLRENGFSETLARVAERHTGTGITETDKDKIECLRGQKVCMLPETELEQLVCYADKFYSKSGNRERKTLAEARRAAAKFGPESVERFDRLNVRFGF